MTMRRGFSLIELMAVAVLMAVLVATATLNMQGLTDEARLRGAAEQVAGCYRLAASEAARTGRPHALLLTPGSCGILRPVWRADDTPEGRWQWEGRSVFDLLPRVAVQTVNDVAGNEGSAAQWRVPVSPTRPVGMRMVFRTAGGRTAAAEYSGGMGLLRLQLMAEEGR